MKISLFLVGTKECKFFSKLSSIIQNNNPISYNPHITLATLNLSKNKNQDIETIIKLSKELATEIQSEHFDVKLNSKISLGTQFFQSIFLECDPSNQTLQKARRISENKFKPFLQEGLFYPHVSLYYGKEDENKKRALNRIENNNFSNFVFRTTAIQLTLYDSSKDHSEWISLGRINLHTPNIFLPQANYVDGRYYRSVDAKSKVEQQMDVFNPANGKVIVEVPNSSANDVNIAIKAAQNAFNTWGKTTGAYRAEFIRKIAALINEHLEDLALLESLDNGKPLGEAREDISACAKQMDYYANLAIDLDKRQDQRVESSDDFLDCRVRYEPIGVCALICPFNYPLMIAIWKLSGCLAAGCTAVIKPSEVTPLSILHLARLINLAGLPAGVFNVLTGDGVTTGNPLVTSPLVDKVSFTGSYLTGSRIMNNVSQGVKAITLELGGKSSLICFDDVENLEDAIDWMLCSIFWNAGQVCSATSRLLLHRSIKDKVVKRLVEEAQKIKVGYGLAEGTKMGPLVSKGQYEKVKRYIESAVKEGATLLTGGLPDPEEFPEGYFIRPTIFDNVTKSMTVWREEIFGPVLLIQSFDTEEEAVRTANETEYGLAGAVFSKDEERCNRVARNLNVGVTWINCAQPSPKELPWGGCKKSGIGRENGVWGLDAFLSVKQITEWSKKSSDKSFKWFNSKL